MAAVYSREIADTVLTLSASGFTYNNTFVLYDYETESMWYHLPGEEGLTCISGKYADQKLKEFPSAFVRWNIWKQSNPNTQYLRYPF
ncbi:MAG: hypothetical protein Kow0042_16540 [Calditrichia bacterium]